MCNVTGKSRRGQNIQNASLKLLFLVGMPSMWGRSQKKKVSKAISVTGLGGL
jgi:hypothetical protein